jgi:phenylpyruvate tautomerase PptA (4-oxalocrotonate tautomerase family)
MKQHDLLNEIANGNNVEFAYADYNVFRKAREVLAEQKRDITEREEYIVRRLYSVGAPKWTAEKLSKKFKITVARIYQIKNATLNKLRHPAVIERLTKRKTPTPKYEFEYDLTVRTTNCLLAEGIYSKEQVIEIWNKEPNDFLKIPNFGRRCFNEIKDWMAQVNPEVKAEPTPEPEAQKKSIATEILDGVVHTLKEAKKNTSVIKNMDNELARGFRNVGQDIQTLTARIIKLETLVDKAMSPAARDGITPLDDATIELLAKDTPLTVGAFKQFTRIVEKALGVK